MLFWPNWIFFFWIEWVLVKVSNWSIIFELKEFWARLRVSTQWRQSRIEGRHSSLRRFFIKRMLFIFLQSLIFWLRSRPISLPNSSPVKSRFSTESVSSWLSSLLNLYGSFTLKIDFLSWLLNPLGEVGRTPLLKNSGFLLNLGLWKVFWSWMFTKDLLMEIWLVFVFLNPLDCELAAILVTVDI